MKHPDHEQRVPARIKARLSYIDSIRLRTYCKLPRKTYMELLDSVRPPLDDGKMRVKSESVLLPTGQRLHFLTIHQPTFVTLDLLDRYEQSEAVYIDAPFDIVRVDVALDLVVKSQMAAARLLRHVVARLLKSSRPRSPWSYESRFARVQRGEVDNPFKEDPDTELEFPDPEENAHALIFETAYLDYEAQRGVRVAIYAHRPTKTNLGLPCCHVEWRVLGAGELRKLGLDTIAQLRALDYRAFWAERLCLVEAPSQEKLATAIATHRGKQRTIDRRSARLNPVRSSSALLRATHDKFEEPNAHDLLLALRAAEHVYGARPIRRFVEVSHDWMLPCRENSLWDDIWERTWMAQRMIAALPAKSRRVLSY